MNISDFRWYGGCFLSAKSVFWLIVDEAVYGGKSETVNLDYVFFVLLS